METEKSRIAIIGAGWAGLSAAVQLHRSGHAVDVFEASHTLGGRARSVHSPKLQTTIDNGQHILLGAYEHSLSLINSLQPHDTTSKTGSLLPQKQPPASKNTEPFLRLPLRLQTVNGQRAIRAWPLPAPFHLLAGLLTAKGYSLRERFRLSRTFQRLKANHWQITGKLTVAQWLDKEQQLPHTIRTLWEPVCLAALNTPIEQACAQMYANVLRDSLGGGRRHSNVLIPRHDLSRLWPHLLPPAIAIHTGTPIRQLQQQQSQIRINNTNFDAAIIACGTASSRRLLDTLPSVEGQDKAQPLASVDSRALLKQLDAFRHAPIATLTLQLKHRLPWPGTYPMLLLEDCSENLEFGQWLFDVPRYWHRQGASHLVAVVISDADRLHNHDSDSIVHGIVRQINRQLALPDPGIQVLSNELIIEKRATFVCTPGLERPGNQTPWPGIYLAGDWTDTGYPAVLEGAVRSGEQAARLLSEALSKKHQ